ncbi:coiled-coil domain-containing protein 60 [Podargus strigoides]
MFPGQPRDAQRGRASSSEAAEEERGRSWAPGRGDGARPSPRPEEGGTSSTVKAPVAPDPSKDSKVKELAATEVLNPRDFVRVQALPGFAQKVGKVLVRSRTIYKSSEPPREQVFWENYHRRQKQFSQGLFSPIGKPYQEIGENLYTDPKALVLFSLGQLAQESVKEDEQEEPPKEAAEPDLPEPQESLERENTLRADKQAHQFQLLNYHSDVEESEEEMYTYSLTEGKNLRKSRKKKKEITLDSFISCHANVLIPCFSGEKRTPLFLQLCAIHWLLEALILGSISSMNSVLTSWNPRNPGGCQKTVKEIQEEKLETSRWGIFISNTKKSTWKTQSRSLSRKVKKAFPPGISQLTSQSYPRAQTSHCSEISTVHCSEDSIKINVSSSSVSSQSAQAKEQQPLFLSLEKASKPVHEVSKDVHKQEDMVKKTGLQRSSVAQKDCKVSLPLITDQESKTSRKKRPRRQSCSSCISSFIESKSNLCADMRQKFTAIREEAAYRLHDTLESLERSQHERCYKKFQDLKQLDFRRDMKRIRQTGKRGEKEHEDQLNWFSVLLARLPKSVKSDSDVQNILSKLEKYDMTPDLKIHPDIFLKVLTDLQVWELCCPDIAAAVEFVRENVVQMQEEDFREWLQTRLSFMG